MALVVKRNGVDFREVLSTANHGLLVAAFATYGIGTLTASYRWYTLLHHIRVRLPFLTVLRLALIGQFFNLFVPGGVGGDLIKMVYLKRESGDRYPQALLTVLLDRLLGLAGLLLVAVVAIGMNQSLLQTGSKEMQAILVVVGLASLGGLVCALLFLAWPLIARVGGQAGANLAQKLPPGVVAVAAKIGEALDLLRAAPGKLILLLFLSAAGHISGACAVYIVVLGVGGGAPLSFSEILLATQLANLVAAIPLTPGGVGNRDLVMSLLLGAAGAPAALAGSVPLLVTVLLVSWSLVGGLALLWERGAQTVVAGIEPDLSKDPE